MRRPTLLARQGRSPSGLLGHLIGRIMARETHAANLIALELLDLASHDRVVEIGFGHGRTLAAAACKVTEGHLAGVDPSEIMLRIAQGANARTLRTGRMDLRLGVSERLPYDAGGFTKAYAVHTIYFWRHPERDLAEILRVLTPGGRLVLGYRPREDASFVRDFPAEIYHIHAIEAVEHAVAAAGFVGVETVSRAMGQGIMAWTVAHKPADAAHSLGRGGGG